MPLAKQNDPSKPYLTDEYDPTDKPLWEKVLMVARGDLRQMTRMTQDGERIIHSPNHGMGFRHWPNPKGVAWAVKQYNGYGGRWKGRKEAMAHEKITGWIGVKVPQPIAQILSNIEVPGTKENPLGLHITMVCMGEASLEEFTRALEATYAVAQTTPPFSLKTSLITCFDKRDDGVPVICKVESAALMSLQRKLCEALDAHNVGYGKKWPVYKPHICLSYAEEAIPNIPIPDLGWGNFEIELWLGHNGSKVTTKLPLEFIRKASVGDGGPSTRGGLRDILVNFRVAWRFKTGE